WHHDGALGVAAAVTLWLGAHRHLDHGSVVAARHDHGVTRLVLVFFDGDAEVVEVLPRPLVVAPVSLGDDGYPGGVEGLGGGAEGLVGLPLASGRLDLPHGQPATADELL